MSCRSGSGRIWRASWSRVLATCLLSRCRSRSRLTKMLRPRLRSKCRKRWLSQLRKEVGLSRRLTGWDGDMAFDQTQLDALDAAIASGELTVKYNGKEITYRSINELVR